MILIKSIIYRIFRILILLVVALVVLGDTTAALSISAIDAVVATAYYYYFDKGWARYLEPMFTELLIKIKYRKFDLK